jgi:hypothetical protein
MTYRAKMVNGKVEFEGGIRPADGVELRVDVVPDKKPAPTSGRRSTLSEVLLSFAGIMSDPNLPVDGSVNHDHYIYGSPKR